MMEAGEQLAAGEKLAALLQVLGWECVNGMGEGVSIRTHRQILLRDSFVTLTQDTWFFFRNEDDALQAIERWNGQ